MANEMVPSSFTVLSPFDTLDQDTLAEIQDEMEDLDSEGGFDYLRIKVPSSGGLAYEVATEDDNVEYLKELECVIVYTHKTNQLWGASYGGGQDNSPICSSLDGKTGMNVATGKLCACASCPNNKYGSYVGPDGTRGRGKACKNSMRVYLLLSGSSQLYMLTVPPTSMRDVDKTIKKMIMSGTPYTGAVVRFSLERAANAAGVTYSKVKLVKLGALTAEQRSKVMQWRSQVKAERQTASGDDYAPVVQTLPPVSAPAAPSTASAPVYAQPVQQPAQPLTGTQMPMFEEVDTPDDDLPF